MRLVQEQPVLAKLRRENFVIPRGRPAPFPAPRAEAAEELMK